MTRKIKFRAWNKPTKQMYHWGFFHDVFRKGAADSRNFEPEHNEFMQFTGLLDRHGKEIYEGDILVTWINVTGELNLGFEIRKGFRVISTWIIKWSENTPSWCIEQVLIDGSRMESGMISNEYLTNFEIIGNIYENKELLENKEI